MNNMQDEVRTAKWYVNGNEPRELGLTIYGAATYIDNYEEHRVNAQLYTATIEKLKQEQEEILQEAIMCITTWPEAYQHIKTTNGLKLYCKHTTNKQYLKLAQTKLFLL